MKNSELTRLRHRIRKTDEMLVEVLNERSRLSIDIGKIKKRRHMDVYDPAKEMAVYRHLDEMNAGPLPPRELHHIFREIISSSRALQAPVSVACLGPEASFSHLAARHHFGEAAQYVSLPTISDVFDRVERKQVACGVVPIENSLEGSVAMTLDHLHTTPLTIRAEILLPIQHCLLSAAAKIRPLRQIYSHPQALAQCQQWLTTHLPRCDRHAVESTAVAVQKVAGDRESAAIGSREAATLYGLNVLFEGIEDYHTNVTRFIVIGEGLTARTGNDKTSILFGTRHEPGALFHALEPFAKKKINLVRIESHPIKGTMWEYLFFADCTGSIADRTVRSCLAALKKKTTFFKILGSYPAGEIPA
ncbi:MAG: prephenate dehydratase [Deltaproteobacteria bacterium]|nr:prephenate dehydratase [Deltaproteobacteria bacterium]